jgi:hypothetical protein
VCFLTVLCQELISAVILLPVKALMIFCQEPDEIMIFKFNEREKSVFSLSNIKALTPSVVGESEQCYKNHNVLRGRSKCCCRKEISA